MLGSVVAWRTGALLGPDSLLSTAAGLKVGARFEGPLDLSAYGVLLAWPLGAVITYFAVAAGAEVTGRRARPDRADQPGRPSGAVRAPLTRSRSAGASRTCSPRRPADT